MQPQENVSTTTIAKFTGTLAGVKDLLNIKKEIPFIRIKIQTSKEEIQGLYFTFADLTKDLIAKSEYKDLSQFMYDDIMKECNEISTLPELQAKIETNADSVSQAQQSTQEFKETLFETFKTPSKIEPNVGNVSTIQQLSEASSIPRGSFDLTDFKKTLYEAFLLRTKSTVTVKNVLETFNKLAPVFEAEPVEPDIVKWHLEYDRDESVQKKKTKLESLRRVIEIIKSYRYKLTSEQSLNHLNRMALGLI